MTPTSKAGLSASIQKLATVEGINQQPQRMQHVDQEVMVMTYRSNSWAQHVDQAQEIMITTSWSECWTHYLDHDI